MKNKDLAGNLLRYGALIFVLGMFGKYQYIKGAVEGCLATRAHYKNR